MPRGCGRAGQGVPELWQSRTGCHGLWQSRNYTLLSREVARALSQFLGTHRALCVLGMH